MPESQNSLISLKEMEPHQLEDRIIKAYPDAQMAVIDTTGQGNHFEIRVSSSTLNQMNRIQRHQTLLQLFEKEFKSGALHALNIKPIKL